MAKLPKIPWLRQADDPTPDLEEQLAEAQRALKAAQQAHRDAEQAFTNDPNTEAELEQAESDVRRAERHVRRATTLLEAARERDESERIRRLREETIPDLEAQIWATAARLDGLAEREADLLEQVATVRLERASIGRELEQLKKQLAKTADDAGVEPPRLTKRQFAHGAGPIRTLLDAQIEQTPVSDPIRRILHHLRPDPIAYH